MGIAHDASVRLHRHSLRHVEDLLLLEVDCFTVHPPRSLSKEPCSATSDDPVSDDRSSFLSLARKEHGQ